LPRSWYLSRLHIPFRSGHRSSLAAVGAGLADGAQLRVYLTHPDQFPMLNAVCREVFEPPFPTRTTVYVALPAKLLVEIDALAVLDGDPPAA
jgi:enamine deaminase RidA (YjgF/YER057c/UK114 family)